MPKSARAQFERSKKRPVGDTEYLYVNAWKKTLTIAAPNGKGSSQTRHASDADLTTAFADACAKAEADGWAECTHTDPWRQQLSGTAPKKPSAAQIERSFDRISNELAQALSAANGNRAAEKKAIAAALTQYAELKALLGGDRMETPCTFSRSMASA